MDKYLREKNKPTASNMLGEYLEGCRMKDKCCNGMYGMPNGPVDWKNYDRAREKQEALRNYQEKGGDTFNFEK